MHHSIRSSAVVVLMALFTCVGLIQAQTAAPPPPKWEAEAQKWQPPKVSDKKMDGYHGIWFTLGQFSEHGDKYSGGLGTYTANHVPIAVYAPKVNKTFFVYGGTIKDERHLLIMASYYDHEKKVVPRPTIVYDKLNVNDPHDNGSLCIDDKGYLWVFVSGRGRGRPGFKFRSQEPYSVDAFEYVSTDEITYPQPWFSADKGFLHLFTKYTAGRELYFETGSPDGRQWSGHRKLAGFRGHYQTSNQRGNLVVSAFNYHPGGSVDRRTNLYVVQTQDFGKTWRNMQGDVLELPLETVENPALVRNYEAEGRLVYINDVNFDGQGRPIVQYITSNGHKPGPENDPRTWEFARWTGSEWQYGEITRSTHNYDVGSIHVEDDGTWRVIGPTETGPQKYGTGGEVAAWVSRDEGKSWTKVADLTKGSRYNHSYVRRPVNANPDFYAYWADGHADELSPSRLYFANQAGDKVWLLPEEVSGEFAEPQPFKSRR
jgi:hypothetical protein